MIRFLGKLFAVLAIVSVVAVLVFYSALILLVGAIALYAQTYVMLGVYVPAVIGGLLIGLTSIWLMWLKR